MPKHKPGGDMDLESIIRVLNRSGYNGLLSVEWEDSGCGSTIHHAFVIKG